MSKFQYPSVPTVCFLVGLSLYYSVIVTTLYMNLCDDILIYFWAQLFNLSTCIYFYLTWPFINTPYDEFELTKWDQLPRLFLDPVRLNFA